MRNLAAARWSGIRAGAVAPQQRAEVLAAGYVAAVTAAAGALAALALTESSLDQWDWLAILAVGAALLESRPISLLDFSGPSRISLTLVPIFAAGLFMGPAEAALVAAVGMMVQFAQRRAWYQALFNLSVAALTGMTAAVTFRALVDAMVPNPSIDEVGAALVAVFAAFLVNTGLVAGVLGLAAGRSPLGIWRQTYAWLTPHYLALGLVGYALALAYESADLDGRGRVRGPARNDVARPPSVHRPGRADLQRLRTADRARCAALRSAIDRWWRPRRAASSWWTEPAASSSTTSALRRSSVSRAR